MSPDAEKAAKKGGKKKSSGSKSDEAGADTGADVEGMATRPAKMVKYLFIIYTSQLDGAGTDGDVSVELVGDQGRANTGVLRLARVQLAGTGGTINANTMGDIIFATGTVNEFQHQLQDIGLMTGVSVSIAPKKTLVAGQKEAHWHVEKILVEKHGEAGSLCEKYTVDCGAWVRTVKTRILISLSYSTPFASSANEAVLDS